MKKNTFFTEAINYFTNFACKNLDDVTWNTLNIINDPTAHQPTPELNMLPLPIKEYVMQLARNEIKLNYEIILEHSDTINLFCICPTTHIVVTHGANKELRLWDLKTNSYITTFPENNHIHTLRFKPDGSQLATVAYYNDINVSHIKIWGLQLQKLLYSIKQKHYVYHIDFTQGASSNVLTVFTQKPYGNKEKVLTLWSLDKNANPILLGSTSPLQWTGEELTHTDVPYKKHYTGYLHGHDRSILYITKKYCPDLHSCRQAIENNTCADTLSNIPNSQPYSLLTKYEQKMIDTDIIKKAAALTLQKK